MSILWLKPSFVAVAQQGEASFAGVATLTAEGSLLAVGEATLQGVASFQGEGSLTTAVVSIEGEALLQAVAHMAFAPTQRPRSTPWVRWSTIGSRRLVPGEHPVRTGRRM